MMNTTCSYNFSHTVLYLEFIVYIPITFFGLLFNVIALWVFCCKLNKWTETRVYMISLATADCSLIFTLPFILYFHRHNWGRDQLCSFIETVFFLNVPLSICMITIVAADRYMGIKHPLRAKCLRSPWTAAVICGFLWIIMIISAVSAPRFSEKEIFCFQKNLDEPLIGAVYYSVLGYFIPLVILSFCSIQVIRCLKKKKKNADSHEEMLVQKALYVVTVNMGVFIMCFLPVNVVLLITFAMETFAASCPARQMANFLTDVFKLIASLNCCLDAVCYYFVAKEFQDAASLLPPFKSLQSRSNRSQDSQLQSCQMIK